MKPIDDPEAAALARAEWLAFVANYEHARRARVARSDPFDAPVVLGARIQLWLGLALCAALWVLA